MFCSNPQLVKFLSPRVKGITLQFHYPYKGEEDELFLPFSERRIVLGVLKQFKDAHPDRWTEPMMLGSLLKRLRNRGEYSW